MRSKSFMMTVLAGLSLAAVAMAGEAPRVDYSWLGAGGFCAEIDTQTGLKRAVDADFCRAEYGSRYAWEAFGNCVEWSVNEEGLEFPVLQRQDLDHCRKAQGSILRWTLAEGCIEVAPHDPSNLIKKHPLCTCVQNRMNVVRHKTSDKLRCR